MKLLHYSPFTIYYLSVDHTRSEFLIQIEELIDNVFENIDELRSTKATGRAQRELIDRLFRSVHSVKGSTASSGLEVAGQIAHELENLLEGMRAGRVAIDDSVLDTCENAAEALMESLNLAAAGILEPSRRALFARLQAAANKTVAGAAIDRQAVLASLPADTRQSLTEVEQQRLVSIAAEGTPLFVVTAVFDVKNFAAEFSRLKELLAQAGEVISTSPALDDADRGKINFRILFAGNHEKLAAGTLEFSGVQYTAVAAVSDERLDSLPETPPVTPASIRSNFVRADLDKLDKLISSTHALLRSTTSTIEKAISSAPTNIREELAGRSEEIRSSFIGLEDELINLRLTSLKPALDRAIRAGRAAARLARKEVDFEISGAEMRLDKLVVEALADPLIHLLRNAVDHGIESVSEREAAGKKRRGTVRISMISEGSQSRLRVTDDGRGVDPAAISEAALRLGIRYERELDIEQSLRLIFRPGFTTATSNSGLSGRGVGLDIVETAIEQVGGELRVSSSPGRGSMFEIRLPVTFGVVAANVIVSAGHRYCIPANQTLGIEALDVIDGTSAADQLRQVSMRELLGQPEAPEDDSTRLQLITCQFTDERAGGAGEMRRIGIVVDHVEGPQEVLVRNLGRHAGRWYGIAGATELRDGTVALVLDLPRLLNVSA
ncbi:MAG TPA: ATP-binding protein [Pyrinomonadaceae bacterium]